MLLAGGEGAVLSVREESPSVVEHVDVTIVILNVLRNISDPLGPWEVQLVAAMRHDPPIYFRHEHSVKANPMVLAVLVDSRDEPRLHLLDLIAAQVEDNRLE